MNPADLEKANAPKAKSIIILAKKIDNDQVTSTMDADAIFMYKTIQANYKHVSIVTELASI